MNARLLLVLLSAVGGGCEVEPYCFHNCNAKADGDSGDDTDAGDVDGGQEPFDSGPDAAPCDPGLAEVCNGRDDDCDTEIDEGIALDHDPANCGACGNDCRAEMPHALVHCELSVCVLDGCDVGFYDIGNESGCEYQCRAVPAEDDSLCNGRDDDCDGQTDEDVLFDTDVNNCGHCGMGCDPIHGSASCQDGDCVLEDCDEGFHNVDKLDDNGCEYACVVAGGEQCNLRDDDCNGETDEGNPEGGAPCGTDIGECEFGTLQCVSGSLVCRGGRSARAERCNGLDDDCNEQIDETFDFDADIDNCGQCGNACFFESAFPLCNLGECEVFECHSGFVNLNLIEDDGCEHPCELNGAEICNGRDDDCNGEPDDGLVPPDTACNANGLCADTVPICEGEAGWVCHYPDGVQIDAQGNFLPETLCDGDDNDCDGATDEHAPLKDTQCSNGVGVCVRLGQYVCDDDAPLGPVVCNAPPAGQGLAEECNGLDDDCNGWVDDGIVDDMVQVSPALWIYRWEASRPGATADDPGTQASRACSIGGVLPWTDVTWEQASAACAEADKRLCTEAEWRAACESVTDTCDWSYDDTGGFPCTTFAANSCNGNEYDFDPNTAGDQDGLLTTGALSHCGSDQVGGEATDLSYDLSGNVKEWTSTDPAGGGVEYRIMGGAYNNPAGGTRCDFLFTVGQPSFHFPNVGFRCCSDTPP